LPGSAAVYGSDGQADYRVAQESAAKVSQDILDVAEFRAHDLVVRAKWFRSLLVVVVGEVNFGIEHAAATLAEVFTNPVLRFENDPLHEAVVEAVEVIDRSCGLFHGGNLKACNSIRGLPFFHLR